MFADEYAIEVEVARANGYNPIEYIQDIMDIYAFKEITKEEVEDYLK